MKTFIVYQSQEGSFKIIKKGFSWPGFFFTAIWLGLGGLWIQLATLLVFILIISFGFVYLVTLSPAGFNDSGIDGLQSLLQLCVALYIGWAGNEWLTDKMKIKGFNAKGHVEAKNKASALVLATEKFSQIK